jgi:hypothetical protein
MSCLSGDRLSLLWRRPGKGPIEVRFDGSPWEPGRSFGFLKGTRKGTDRGRKASAGTRSPERRDASADRTTADSGGRQQCRPPFAFGGRRVETRSSFRRFAASNGTRRGARSALFSLAKFRLPPPPRPHCRLEDLSGSNWDTPTIPGLIRGPPFPRRRRVTRKIDVTKRGTPSPRRARSQMLRAQAASGWSSRQAPAASRSQARGALP